MDEVLRELSQLPEDTQTLIVRGVVVVAILLVVGIISRI